MVILSIADMHLRTEQDHSVAFKNSLANFTKFMATTIIPDDRWKPDFICICGDITDKAKKEEFEKAQGIVSQIAQSAELSGQYVMMVPGNHDLVRPTGDSDTLDRYVNDTKRWLDNGNKIPDDTHSAFSTYAAFRASMLQETDSIQYVDLMKELKIDDMRGLYGLRVFHNDKVVFAEFNSTWCDIGGTRRSVRLGNILVNKAFQRLQQYKDAGYFIVGMFHHSLRFLDVQEYQVRSHFHVYDNIVKVCDICLSGHEHGMEAKDPDALGNSCQYILNAGFFSIDPENFLHESGATLLRINRNEETLQVRKLLRKSDNTWHDSDTISTYSLAIRRHTSPINPEIPKTPIPKNVSSRDDRTMTSAILRIFGDSFSLGNKIDGATDTYELRSTATGQLEAHVVFADQYNALSVDAALPAEHDKKLLVINVNGNYTDCKDPTDAILRKRFRKQILSGRVVVLSS